MKAGGIRSIIAVIFSLAVVSLATGCATPTQTAQAGAINRARVALSAGNYEFALQRLNAAETYGDISSDRKAEIFYLKGICHEGLNQPLQARAMFKLVAENYPETELGQQAKLKLSQH